MGNMSGNVSEFLLHIIRGFKSVVTTAMKTLNSTVKTQNTKLANNNISSLMSALT